MGQGWFGSQFCMIGAADAACAVCKDVCTGVWAAAIRTSVLLQMFIRLFKEMAQKKFIPEYEDEGKPLGGPVKVEGRGTPALPGAESASIE